MSKQKQKTATNPANSCDFDKLSAAALDPNSSDSALDSATQNATKRSKRTGSQSAKKPKKIKPQTAKKLLKYLRPHLWLIILSVLFSLVFVSAQLFAPVFVGRAIDHLADKTAIDFGGVFKNIVVLICLVATAVFFQFVTGALGAKAAHGVIADIRSAAFKKLDRVPLKEIDSSNRGDLIHRVISDADRVADGLIQGFTSLFSGLVTIVGTLVLMLNLNVYVALSVIVLTPISVVVAYFIARLSQRMFTRQVTAEGRLSSHTEEYISNQRLVKLFNLSGSAGEKFDLINGQIKDAGSKAVFFSALVNPSTRLVSGLVHVVVCILGALLIVGKHASLSVGEYSVFLTYALQYAKPFNEISSIVTEMQIALVSARRLIEILDKQDEPDERLLPALEIGNADVCFDNVSFSYGDQPFIEGFDLAAAAGEHIAIVGRTGCGKTTVISLLMRFYELSGGRILVDGANTAEHNRGSVRGNIGMVLQDSWLFRGSVRDNIAYGREDATLAEVIDAAKRANIDGYIQNLAHGYDTVLEPQSLSAGQMQLLCIARVFLTSPKILILDEATSNIDARTELKIQEAIKAMTHGHTSFIVAHRLSTIKNADKIVVMDNGKIVECGKHDDLLSRRGKYYDMINALENS